VKIAKNARDCRLPGDFGQIVEVAFVIEPALIDMPLIAVHFEEILRLRSTSDRLVGRPIYFCVATTQNRLWFFPRAERAGKLRIRYLPAMKEY